MVDQLELLSFWREYKDSNRVGTFGKLVCSAFNINDHLIETCENDEIAYGCVRSKYMTYKITTNGENYSPQKSYFK